MSEIVTPLGAQALTKPLMRLMRPLVRLLVQNGITFPVFADLMRALYVDIASDLLTDPRAQTDSRLSLLTGVHRKEIRRLRELPRTAAAAPSLTTLSSQIISRWLGMEPWMDDQGAPRRLPRSAQVGLPSFESLVTSVTTDLRPRAVLDEWTRSGVVHVSANDEVVLNQAAFLPRPGQEQQLFYFARNLHDHIAAAGANITAANVAPFLDRSVHYDRLTPEAVQELTMYGREKAQELLLAFNRTALARIAQDEQHSDEPATPATPPARATHRINLGIYLYSDDAPSGPEV